MGFVPYLLIHLKMLLEQNYTGTKITPSGFLKLLIENKPNAQLTSVNGESVEYGKLSTASGMIRELKYKFLPRITDDQIGDTDNCDNDFGFQYTEGSIETPLFSKGGFQIEWGFVERYEAEAARLVATGNPSTPVLNELVTQLMHAVNGMIVNIDKKLLNQLVFGVNAESGNNLAKPLNINKDGSVLDLSNGITEILSDAAINEFAGEPLIVGSGLFNKFEIAKSNIGLNGGGMNQGTQGGYKFYYDLNTAGAAELGVDQIGVFAANSVGFFDIDRYIAWKAGKHGNSWFCTIHLPVENSVAGAAPVMMPFNLQIKEIDCPEDDFDGYSTRTMDRGYKIIITKRFGLFQQPLNAYQAADRLTGTNGALRYTVANDCDSCGGAV